MSSLFTASLGQLSYGDLFDGQSDVISRLMYGIYMIVMIFLMINMFVAVIMDNYSDVCGDDSQYYYDQEIVDYAWGLLTRVMNSMFKSNGVFSANCLVDES